MYFLPGEPAGFDALYVRLAHLCRRIDCVFLSFRQVNPRSRHIEILLNLDIGSHKKIQRLLREARLEIQLPAESPATLREHLKTHYNLRAQLHDLEIRFSFSDRSTYVQSLIARGRAGHLAPVRIARLEDVILHSLLYHFPGDGDPRVLLKTHRELDRSVLRFWLQRFARYELLEELRL